MRSIARNYFKNCAAVLFVYDITNRLSFENVARWLEDAENYSHKEICKILVGNKSDLEYKRIVGENEGKAFAKENNMLFIEASAKNNENVERIFSELGFDVWIKLQNG